MENVEAPPTSAALRLLVVLTRSYFAVERHIKADIARHGLTIAEFGALEVLYHKGPMLLGEVKRKILISSGGITYVIDRLEEKGLVRRRECAEDRRAIYAELTSGGEALMQRIFPEHARCVEHALSGLTEQEQRAAAALLRTLGREADRLESCAPEA